MTRSLSTLGPAIPRRLDQPITVSLEDLVPANHFSSHLEAKLDLGFARDRTLKLYTAWGRPAIHRGPYFTLQLVRVFEEIRSERTLMKTANAKTLD